MCIPIYGDRLYLRGDWQRVDWLLVGYNIQLH